MKVTRHAKDRGHDRAGLDAKAFEGLAAKALADGLCHADCKGQLKGWVSRLFMQQRKANNIRIYGEFVYLFNRDTLITVLHLPNEFKAVVKKLANRKQCE